MVSVMHDAYSEKHSNILDHAETFVSCRTNSFNNLYF